MPRFGELVKNEGMWVGGQVGTYDAAAVVAVDVEEDFCRRENKERERFHSGSSNLIETIIWTFH